MFSAHELFTPLSYWTGLFPRQFSVPAVLFSHKNLKQVNSRPCEFFVNLFKKILINKSICTILTNLSTIFKKQKYGKPVPPYFEKRNIHFYVNKCGFHITEFINPYHPAKDSCGEKENEAGGHGNEYFLHFEKKMK